MSGGPTTQCTVAIAGASGFIGTALRRDLAGTYKVVALTRSRAIGDLAAEDASQPWRACDLFSLDAVRMALRGVHYAIYLVHSQAPSSRLTQAKPADMDLILADNFARAAADNGVQQIIVVGGLIPRGFRISPLLWGRREVEMVLRSRGTPVTALRVGLVVGPGGSATRLLIDLVRRLVVIPLPPAARSTTRPIALCDLVKAIRRCLGRPGEFNGQFDIGGPDCLSYEEMLRQTARVLALPRLIFTVPFMPIGFAAFGARLASQAPPSLVGPIIESLPQDTVIADNRLQDLIDADSVSFQEGLAAALGREGRRSLPSPRQPMRGPDRILIRQASLVRSVQRIILPPGQDAAWIAGNYFRWLGTALWPLASTECDEAGCWEVALRFPRRRLLFLRYLASESTRDRRVYQIAGGLLSRDDAPSSARFEFQTVLDGRYTMAAIHDYAPRIPWPIYLSTQAIVHRWIMRRYQGRLARLAR